MAATDTVVGIVGAVLLAGIMVAVFVYEYNNTPDDGGGAGDDTLRAFNATYPALLATDDLDEDGTPNHLDADMDGDGMQDADQSGNLVVRKEFSGSITGPAPPNQANSMEHAFSIGQGRGIQITANLTYDTQVPGLPGQTPLPNIRIALDGPEDSDVPASEATVERSGNTVTVTVTLDDAMPGNYTLVVTVGPPPQVSTAYEAVVAIDYGLARGASGEPASPR